MAGFFLGIHIKYATMAYPVKLLNPGMIALTTFDVFLNSIGCILLGSIWDAEIVIRNMRAIMYNGKRISDCPYGIYPLT